MMVPRADYVSSCISENYSGKVMQVFERAINVLGDGPLWILGPMRGPQPLGIRLNFLPKVEKGEPILKVGDKLRIGKNYYLDLTGAEVWSTSNMSINEIDERVYRELTLWAERYILHPEHVNFLINGDNQSSDLDAVVVYRLRELTLHALNGGFDLAKEIIGLGTGLTPAGDDALVGMLASLRGSKHFAGLKRVIEGNFGKTNWVSQGYLRCAVQGEFGWEASGLINACAKHGNLEYWVKEASRVGHSSGSFFVLGFIGGLTVRLM